MSQPPWDLDAGFPGTPVEGPLRVDAVVVGGDPAAVAAASRLRAGGAQVALVPLRPWSQVGVVHGPGVALPALAEHYSTMVRDLGRENARRWWSLAAEGAAALRRLLTPASCSARRGGALLVAANEAESRELTDGLRELTDDGFSPRMMGAAAASNYLPVEADFGALYVPGAVTFDPARALAALLASAAEAGVRILPPEARGRLLPEGEGVRVDLAAGAVHAEIAVLTSARLLDVGDRPRVIPLRGQLLTTGPVREGMTDVTVAASANRGHEVYRSGPDGGVLAAGINPGSGPKESTEDLEVDDTFQAFLEKFLNERFPESRRTTVTRRWAAVYDMSVDGLPLVGPLPGQPRVHALLGFGASPWSLGWGAGEALAAVLGGGENALPEGASPRRFSS